MLVKGKVKTRWAEPVPQDVEAIAAIDALCFPKPWSLGLIADFIAPDAGVIMVTDVRDKGLVGYVAYLNTKGRAEIIRAGIHPKFRRKGYGRRMLDDIYGRLCLAGMSHAAAFVSEHNLDAQLWLKACEFEAQRVKRGSGPEGEDEYRFVRRPA